MCSVNSQEIQYFKCGSANGSAQAFLPHIERITSLGQQWRMPCLVVSKYDISLRILYLITRAGINPRKERDKWRDRNQCSEAAEPDGEEAGFCLGLGSGELGFAALILGFQFWAGGLMSQRLWLTFEASRFGENAALFWLGAQPCLICAVSISFYGLSGGVLPKFP